MRPRLDSRPGTFTDVACRLKTSCSASGPSSGTAALSEVALPASGILRCFGGVIEIQTELISRGLGLRPDQAWTGCQHRPSVASPFRTVKALAVVRLNRIL